MEELSFDVPLIECSNCGYDFNDGDTIYYDKGNEGYLEIEDIFNCRFEHLFCEDCKDTVYCEDCDNLHKYCECLG